jgi:hypothetical protein
VTGGIIFLSESEFTELSNFQNFFRPQSRRGAVCDPPPPDR